MRSRISIGLLVLVLAALACASPFSVVTSEAPPNQQQVSALPSVTPFIAESYPTAAAESISPNQVVSGIDVRVERAWLEGKQVNADVCYTLPDASDWTIWSASLKYGDVVSDQYGATLLSTKEPTGDGQPGQRPLHR